ncbi:NfeD family protein [Actinomycetota bacterium]
MNLFADTPWLAWVALALILAAIEVASVDFVFLMLAGGALAGALAAGLGAGLPVQVIAAVVSAAILLGVVRPVIRRRFMAGEADHGIGYGALVGQRAQVLQPVSETDGRVKLAGETWSARIQPGDAPCQPGQEVRVVGIEGATAIVTGIVADQIES